MNKTEDPKFYTEYTIVPFNLKGFQATFVTKPGIPNWQTISPSDLLITENISVEPESKYLLLGCGTGIAAAFIAQKLTSGHLWTSDVFKTALECTKRTLKICNVQNWFVSDEISLGTSSQNEFHHAVIILPKGRNLTRRWLVDAHKALLDDGELYLVGANAEGIKSAVNDAEALLGSKSTVLGFKKGYRIIRLRKTKDVEQPEWFAENGIAPDTWYTFDLNISGKNFLIYSLPGVFSYKHLDEGTSLLLNNLRVEPDDCIADVGCGYGIIGMTAHESPRQCKRLDMIDNNLLAVASCKKTLEKNLSDISRRNINVIAGDLLSDFLDRKYTLILTNPPFHTGKATDYSITEALIYQANKVLTHEGRLLLVANKFIRYEQILKQYFQKLTILDQNNRFRVIEASHSYNP